MDGLLADSTEETIRDVVASFPTAQHIRVLLQKHGFIPIVKIARAENWVRNGRRVMLLFDGDKPGEADIYTCQLRYATLVRTGDGWTLSLD